MDRYHQHPPKFCGRAADDSILGRNIMYLLGEKPILIWADSDNGSTGRLQRFSRGSIPRRSTINVFNDVPVV
jgi:hypothetical protein